MTGRIIRSRAFLLLPAALLLLPWWWASAKLKEERAEMAAGRESTLRTLRPGEFFGTVAAGGFRAVLIDYLWMRASLLERKQDYYRLEATYEMLSQLQPRAVEVWIYNAQNLVYNISAEYHTAASQYRWVAKGLRLNRRGLEYVPDSLDLREQLAFFFFTKFSYYENPFSREFRRLLRHEPEGDFLVYKEKGDALVEALYWLDEILARPPAVLEKWGREHLVYQMRIGALEVLLREKEITAREARLDVLEAQEALNPPNVGRGAEQKEAARQLLELRRAEYEEAWRRLAEQESGADKKQREEWKKKLDASERRLNELRPAAAGRGTMPPAREWNAAVDEVLAGIDAALDLYERALKEQDSPQVRRVITRKEFESLNALAVRSLVTTNTDYIVPLYTEALRRLLPYVEPGEAEGGQEKQKQPDGVQD